MRFHIVNLGCKVNRVESDSFERELRSLGHLPCIEEEAELIVVNTCTVTGEAEKKTRKAVRHALRANEQAHVVVTGCAAAIDAAAFERMDARVQTVPKASMHLFLRELPNTFGALNAADSSGATDTLSVSEAASTLSALKVAAAPSVSDAHISDALGALSASDTPADFTKAHAESVTVNATPNANAGLFTSRTRVGVKVQDGCDNACTYCIVHVARGKATSRPLAEVRAEVAALARAGVREIVLSGINIGSYNDSGVRLASLLETLLADTEHVHNPDEPACRFRVSSIEPVDVDDDFVALLGQANGRVCRHVHLPLQAGSDKVLREMARPYVVADYVSLVDRLRASAPELALTTDIIAGFPGETDDEFQETLDTAWRCGFSKIHVFPYSRRAGTPAAARADQIPAQVKSARAAVLRQLSLELRAADRARRAGTAELALVEESGRAMTESYYEVSAPKLAPVGTLVSIKL